MLEPKGDTGVASPAATPAGHFGKPLAPTTATPKGGGDGSPDPVAYVRFKEVVDEKNDLSKKVDELIANSSRERQAFQQQFAQVLDVLKNQSQVTTSQRQDAQEVDPLKDPEFAAVRAHFGEGEAGDKAFKAVFSVVKAATKKDNGSVDTNTLLSKVAEIVDSRFNSFNKTIAQSQRLQKWVTDGVVTKPEADKISGRMQEYIRDNPKAWEGHMEMLTSLVSTELMEKGEIKPWSTTKSGNSPFQPGGGNNGANNYGDDGAGEMASLRAMYPSLRALDDKRLKSLHKKFTGDTTPDGDMSMPEYLHGRYGSK